MWVRKFEGLRHRDSIAAWKSLRDKMNVIRERGTVSISQIEICFGHKKWPEGLKLRSRAHICLYEYKLSMPLFQFEGSISLKCWKSVRNNRSTWSRRQKENKLKGYLPQSNKMAQFTFFCCRGGPDKQWNTLGKGLAYQTRRVGTEDFPILLVTSLARIRQLGIMLKEHSTEYFLKQQHSLVSE